MVTIVRTGRTPHETVEIPPPFLDCGHPYTPGAVHLGFESLDPARASERVRTYRCGDCGETTYSVRS
jgi:hypothetical protein